MNLDMREALADFREVTGLDLAEAVDQGGAHIVLSAPQLRVLAEHLRPRPTLTPEELADFRRSRAHQYWGQMSRPARKRVTQPARNAFSQRLLDQADPDGVLPPEEQAARVEELRREHMARMTQRSAEVRRQKREEQS